MLNVLRFGDEVPRTVLRLMKRRVRTRMAELKFLETLLLCHSSRKRLTVECSQKRFVLFLCFLNISDAILFISQVYAPEAMFAIAAEGEKETLAAVFGKIRALKSVTSEAVNAIETKLRLESVGTFQTIFGAPNVFAVHAIFRIGRAENHVAVAVVGKIVAKIAIFIANGKTCVFGRQSIECSELFEKRPVK